MKKVDLLHAVPKPGTHPAAIELARKFAKVAGFAERAITTKPFSDRFRAKLVVASSRKNHGRKP